MINLLFFVKFEALLHLLLKIFCCELIGRIAAILIYNGHTYACAIDEAIAQLVSYMYNSLITKFPLS